MPSGLPLPDPGQDDPAYGWDVTGYPLDEDGGWRPVASSPDWLEDPEELEAWLAAAASGQPPPDPEHDPGWMPDSEEPPPPGDPVLDAIRAESRRIAAGQAVDNLAEPPGTAGFAFAAAAAASRRGPGMPGSAQRVPGVYSGPAGGFGSGQPLDVAPGGAALHSFAENAAGDDDRWGRVSDDELAGVISALDRAEAAACARKHVVLAELIRRRPYPGCALQGPARMPDAPDEFSGDEVAVILAENRATAGAMLALAWDLEVKLPGTKAAFAAGLLRHSKVTIIALATRHLDPDEARAAEAKILGRAGRLTPGGLRAAIGRAAMEVAPGKARKRREDAARQARVLRWAEDSGNAALAGRDLPPAQVLAADQRITWWARQLKKAGLEGGIDQLRARAYLDFLLDQDSRPAPASRDAGAGHGEAGHGEAGHGEGGASPGADGAGPPHPAGPYSPPGTGTRPAGFAGRLHLTVPLITLLGLADRPGELAGLGPADPWLARDLTAAAAANPKTTWCVTVTDPQGHAIGHGCARPEPHRKPQAKQQKPGAPDGHDPPGEPERSGPGEPRFAFTAAGQAGPPGGYGSWRLATGIPGQPGLLIAFDPIAVDTCDHRFEAPGHDPGVKLRHLSQIRHATCVSPVCRRPATQADFEHNTPYEAGGRSCLCNGSPKCRHDHRLKQHPQWKVEQPTPGTLCWTTPSGRTFCAEPTRYPI